MILVIARLLVACLVGFTLLLAYRWVHARSRLIGSVLAAGLLLRLGAGVVLFLASWNQWPIAGTLQAGGGFWRFAPDARGYFLMAEAAIDTGQWPVDQPIGVAAFVNLLSAWMAFVGISPAAGALLNASLYAALVSLLVAWFAPRNDAPADLPLIVAVAVVTFSPAAALHATQPLKEDAALLSVAALAVSLAWLLDPLRHRAPAPRLPVAALTAAGCGVSIAALASIRWHVAFVLWCAITIVAAPLALRRCRASLPYALVVLAVVAATFTLWLAASGGYGRTVVQALEPGTVTSPARNLVALAGVARLRFLGVGGSSAIATPLRDDPSGGSERREALRAILQRSPIYDEVQRGRRSRGATAAPVPPDAEPLARQAERRDRTARAIPVSAWDHARVAGRGLVLFFIPSPFVSLAGLDVPPSGALRAVSDLDTILADLGLALLALLAWRRRALIRSRLPLALALTIAGAATVVLVGFVVTNFGALWRLRPAATMPLWLVALAFAHRPVPGHGTD